MDADLDLCLAPLRGVTGRDWRAVFGRHFGGLTRAMTPFIPTVRGARVRPALLMEAAPERAGAPPLIPQVIGKEPADLTVMLEALRELGHTAANLNAGCPWPMVARKGRGAGLLADADRLARMLEAGCAAMPGGFSIKTRLGLTTPDLLAQRMTVINAFPLSEVIIHPRTARQMYAGRVDLAAFDAARRLCRHPVTYNGDIRAPADAALLRARFPDVRRWMLGRGLVADPWLAEQLRGAPPTRDAARLRAFLDDLLAATRATAPGDKPALGRMKEMWGYLAERLAPDGRLLRAIRLCQRLEEYQRVVDEIFRRPFVWREAPPGLAAD